MDAVLAATQADLFWLPSHVERLERPDVLALRDGSDLDLHNQVVRIDSTDIPALIREIDAFHTGSSQWLVVPTCCGAQLERHLPAFGYAPTFQGDAFTLETHRRFPEGDLQVVEVHDRVTLDDNIRVCHASFGRAPKPYDGPVQLALCTGPGRRTARFVGLLDGVPVGSANLNLYPALGFGFLWAGGVLPEARGRGVYRALLGARLRWAEAHGLAQVGLYANRDTSGPVVAGLGFQRHGTMAYWQRT